MTVFVVGRILLLGDYCILTKDSMLNDFYLMYSVWRILLSADKTLFHSFYCPSQKGGIYVDETLLIEFIAYWQKTVFIAYWQKTVFIAYWQKTVFIAYWQKTVFIAYWQKTVFIAYWQKTVFIAYWQKTVFIAQQFLLLHSLRPRSVCWRNDWWSWGKRGSSPTLDWPGKPPWWEMISSCCWSLLHSTILHSQADSLRSRVIRHEWLAFYSALSPAPWRKTWGFPSFSIWSYPGFNLLQYNATLCSLRESDAAFHVFPCCTVLDTNKRDERLISDSIVTVLFPFLHRYRRSIVKRIARCLLRLWRVTCPSLGSRWLKPSTTSTRGWPTSMWLWLCWNRKVRFSVGAERWGFVWEQKGEVLCGGKRSAFVVYCTLVSSALPPRE